ncbi:FAD/FMN-containing dehydrogenase [Microaerobacter geothermalis]|uniref:FAD/FMN-containing dehydrogenase n=1 Tax=Microaerobacter geothermalis TaxID=674972 RepID=UPI001F487621|nr:FAD/FMN-containing dehydrogenase [Microaerobacter geothermalis]MCF6093941.1 FAD/FMN-containing dehydrogenase [Microaerobacter geothermalis]
MKKTFFTFGLVVLVLSIGIGAAFAESDLSTPYGFDFESMLPFMQQIHPDVDAEVFEQMYTACHGDGTGNTSYYGGMMGGNYNYSNMMGSFFKTDL